MQNTRVITQQTTTTIATTGPLRPQQAVEAFMVELAAKNRSEATIAAYRTDLTMFTTWLAETNIAIQTIGQVERIDIVEYLAELGKQKLSGVTRARKLTAIRELFRSMVEIGQVTNSPTTTIETPKKERNARVWLVPEEYRAMLALAGSNPREYAILQVFLQTGIRVSELCNLRVDDMDFTARVLRITQGKGKQAREVDLEKKGIQAIKNWLAVRPDVSSDHLFLNQYGEPIGERGVKKLVTKYRVAAGISKRAGCHSLRHTCATYKAGRGVSAFPLKEILGHVRLDTTQIYVHMARESVKKEMERTSL